MKDPKKSSTFFKDVYEVVQLIPEGRVSTYGAIAHYLGIKSGARMVGWALNSSMGDLSIPAHRVVNRMGLLTGKIHFSDPCEMEKRLMAEGIQVKNDQVLDFNNLFWDPALHLS